MIFLIIGASIARAQPLFVEPVSNYWQIYIIGVVNIFAHLFIELQTLFYVALAYEFFIRIRNLHMSIGCINNFLTMDKRIKAFAVLFLKLSRAFRGFNQNLGFIILLLVCKFFKELCN